MKVIDCREMTVPRPTEEHLRTLAALREVVHWAEWICGYQKAGNALPADWFQNLDNATAQARNIINTYDDQPDDTD
jgi:hypothetical protein